ncbi:ATP-grasp domain-containing protein [Streptomyces rameus]|uniref:ATP-grasp domain-containing protein n=1 Tax=Streptomyces rameus TaxID=68261 RepID=A0ABP6MQN0_9ACTN
MAQPVVLLGAGGQDFCGEFPLARIAAVHPVLLVDQDPPAWARPYLAGHLAADPAEARTAEAVLRYTAGDPVGGVLTWSGEHLVSAARIAARLGLPGLPYETAAACADPVALRALLTRHRVPTATPEDPDDADGPLVSAEAVVLDDEVRIVALTRTTPGPPPARRPLRHCVHAHDGLLHNRFLRQCVERAVRALGLTHTVAHLTLRLTARGPRVLGVAPHLPGDLIPLLVERATGVDLAGAAAALATGRHPDVTPTRQRAAAVQFAYPATTGRLTHLRLDPAAADEPAAERMVLTRRTGDPVTAAAHADPADRLAHWVATGEDAAECEETLRRMARHLTATVTPTAATYAA